MQAIVLFFSTAPISRIVLFMFCAGLLLWSAAWIFRIFFKKFRIGKDGAEIISAGDQAEPPAVERRRGHINCLKFPDLDKLEELVRKYTKKEMKLEDQYLFTTEQRNYARMLIDTILLQWQEEIDEHKFPTKILFLDNTRRLFLDRVTEGIEENHFLDFSEIEYKERAKIRGQNTANIIFVGKIVPDELDDADKDLIVYAMVDVLLQARSSLIKRKRQIEELAIEYRNAKEHLYRGEYGY